MGARFDHVGVTGSAGRFPEYSRTRMRRMFTVHARFHLLTISRSEVPGRALASCERAWTLGWSRQAGKVPM